MKKIFSALLLAALLITGGSSVMAKDLKQPFKKGEIILIISFSQATPI